MEWTTMAWLALAAGYLALNLAAMIAYGLDKHRARKGGARVPERTLLLWALVGPLGAMAGMRAFRHKTRKALFKLVPLFALLHLLLLILLVY